MIRCCPTRRRSVRHYPVEVHPDPVLVEASADAHLARHLLARHPATAAPDGAARLRGARRRRGPRARDRTHVGGHHGGADSERRRWRGERKPDASPRRSLDGDPRAAAALVPEQATEVVEAAATEVEAPIAAVRKSAQKAAPQARAAPKPKEAASAEATRADRQTCRDGAGARDDAGRHGHGLGERARARSHPCATHSAGRARLNHSAPRSGRRASRPRGRSTGRDGARHGADGQHDPPGERSVEPDHRSVAGGPRCSSGTSCAGVRW